MSNAAISVIIPFYGSKTDLQKCLDGLYRQNFSDCYEIIVIESGNDPDVRAMVNKISNTHLISSDDVMTPGRARNLGVKKSAASVLAFIDADCLPDEEWLSEIYNSLQAHEIVIGPVLNQYPFHPLASVDNLLQFVDFQKYRNTQITHFPACNLGIKKDLFMEISGFPENLITGEDVIFSEAAIKYCKGSMTYNKKLIVKHSGRKKFSQFIKHNEVLGFYRGYFNLKIKITRDPAVDLLFYSLYFGIRRLIYITIRTLQWNPIGILRIFLYFPLVIIGLSFWSMGFYNGNLKYSMKDSSVITDWRKGYK